MFAEWGVACISSWVGADLKGPTCSDSCITAQAHPLRWKEGPLSGLLICDLREVGGGNDSQDRPPCSAALPLSLSIQVIK